MKQPDMNKIKQNILKIIQEYPDAANNKPLLYEQYWTTYDGWNSNNSLYWNLTKATRPATIDRRLRELREAGLVALSEEREKEVIEAMKNEQSTHAVSWLDD